MIRIGTYRTREDAELAQAALAAADIPSVLEADDAGGSYPFDLTSAARLFVADADADDAAAVLVGSHRRPGDHERQPDGSASLVRRRLRRLLRRLHHTGSP